MRFDRDSESEPTAIIAIAVFLMTLAAAPLTQAVHQQAERVPAPIEMSIEHRVQPMRPLADESSLQTVRLQTPVDREESLCCPLRLS